jgi:hypothetical protein
VHNNSGPETKEIKVNAISWGMLPAEEIAQWEISIAGKPAIVNKS